MNVLINQVRLEFKLFFRRRDELFWTLIFPAFFIVLFGLIYGNGRWDSMRAIDYISPGIIVMAMMTTGIMTSATGFVGERDQGIYRRLAVTPLKRQVIIGSQLINRYLIILVQTIILLAIGIIAWRINIIGNWFFLWVVVTLGALCFLAIGFALTAAIKSAKSATPVAMIIFFLLMFLGGIFFPVEIMPKAVGYFSNILPSTHLNDALRVVAIEGSSLGDVWLNIGAVIGWTAACLVLAVRFFRWE